VFNCLYFKELHPPGSVISTKNKANSALFGLINREWSHAKNSQVDEFGIPGVQCPRHCLGYEAVLAAFAGTFTNEAAQGSGDVRRAHDRSPLRLTLDGPDLGQTDEVLDVLVAFPFPLFLG